MKNPKCKGCRHHNYCDNQDMYTGDPEDCPYVQELDEPTPEEEEVALCRKLGVTCDLIDPID